MAKTPEQWIKQADYDMDTAEYMFKGGRYFYAVFMCHLSIEKALKGIYLKKLLKAPPKVHNLVYLINKIGIRPPELTSKFLIKLNQSSIATRYPEDIDKLQRDYTQPVVKDMIIKGKEVLRWIKKQL